MEIVREGQIVAHKLDGRRIVVIKTTPADSDSLFFGRYLNDIGQMEEASFSPYEVKEYYGGDIHLNEGKTPRETGVAVRREIEAFLKTTRGRRLIQQME